MSTYYGADGRPLGTGRYFKGSKFRMSPHCYGCHIKIEWLLCNAEFQDFGYPPRMSLPELQHPEAIQKDGKHHHCWMPCISPHYEMIYVEDGGEECPSIS